MLIWSYMCICIYLFIYIYKYIISPLSLSIFIWPKELSQNPIPTSKPRLPESPSKWLRGRCRTSPGSESSATAAHAKSGSRRCRCSRPADLNPKNQGSYGPFNTNLVGGIPTPMKNILRQLGWLFQIYGKIKHVPNHQPAIISTSRM